MPKLSPESRRGWQSGIGITSYIGATICSVQTETDKHRHPDTQTPTATYTQTLTDSHTPIHTHRLTQTHRHTYTHTHTHTHSDHCVLRVEYIGLCAKGRVTFPVEENDRNPYGHTLSSDVGRVSLSQFTMASFTQYAPPYCPAGVEKYAGYALRCHRVVTLSHRVQLGVLGLPSCIIE